jgi:hypothetical protein
MRDFYTATKCFGGNKLLTEFVKITQEMQLANPIFLDYALPGNRECGVCLPGVPDDLQQYCMHHPEITRYNSNKIGAADHNFDKNYLAQTLP